VALLTDGVRIELSFADPLATPAWEDVTSRTYLSAGVSISRGRGDEFDAPQPGECELTFDNVDGLFTPGHPSAHAGLRPGVRVRVRYGTSYPRFDGFIEGWPVRWPTGGDSECWVTVKAYDLLSRLGRMPPLRSVIEQTILPSSPAWYFPLAEPDGSVSAGDVIGSGASVSVVPGPRLGDEVTGPGTLTFGQGTGPATDGKSAPEFVPASDLIGFFLRGDVPSVAGSPTLAATFCVKAANPLAEQNIAKLTDGYRTGIELWVMTDGRLLGCVYDPWRASRVGIVTSLTSVVGQTHTAAIAWTASGGTSTVTLTLDGAVVGTGTFTGTTGLLYQLRIGGGEGGGLFGGSISHVLGWSTPPSTATLADYWAASSTGFTGERSDQRIARILGWVGIPSGWLSLDVGSVAVGHVDPTGKKPLELVQDMAKAEGGPLFMDATGLVRLHARNRVTAPVAATLSTTADCVGPDLAMTQDLNRVVNDVTVSRPGGASVRVTDPESIVAYGLAGESLEIAVATDSILYDVASWRLALRSTPQLRTPQIVLDALTDAAHALQILSLEVSSRVTVSGLPGQAPTSTLDLTVQGYTEKISTDEWTVTANTTPYLALHTLTWDDATAGALDGVNHWSY